MLAAVVMVATVSKMPTQGEGRQRRGKGGKVRGERMKGGEEARRKMDNGSVGLSEGGP